MIVSVKGHFLNKRKWFSIFTIFSGFKSKDSEGQFKMQYLISGIIIMVSGCNRKILDLESGYKKDISACTFQFTNKD